MSSTVDQKVTPVTASERGVLRRAARKVERVQNKIRDAIRAVGITVGGLAGSVLVAIGLAALAARFAPAGSTFPVALGVAAAAALLGSLAVGPLVYRFKRRPSTDVTAPDGREGPPADADPARTA
jgi:predicted lysophospholipase L1 biosynthesis ABC-type transport system permease subunit